MWLNIVWSNCHVASVGCGVHVFVVALLVFGAYIWMRVCSFFWNYALIILKRVEFENLRSQIDEKTKCIFWVRGEFNFLLFQPLVSVACSLWVEVTRLRTNSFISSSNILISFLFSFLLHSLVILFHLQPHQTSSFLRVIGVFGRVAMRFFLM